MKLNGKVAKTMWGSLLALGTLLSIPTTALAGTQSSTAVSTSSTATSSINLYAPLINLKNYKSYKVIGSGTPGEAINIRISDTSGNSIKEAAKVQSNGAWSITNINVSKLADGKIAIVSTQDGANGVMTTKTFSTHKNTTVPVAPTVSKKQPNIKKSNDTQYTVSGTGTAGLTVHFTLTDSSGHTITGEAIVGPDGAWSDPSVDPASLSKGHVYVDAYQMNSFGNAGPKSATVKTTKTTVANTSLSKSPLHLMTSTQSGSSKTKVKSNSMTSNSSIYLPSYWTGIFVLNKPYAALLQGHTAGGILLPNGKVYYESFDDGGSQVWPWNQPGKWDPAYYGDAYDGYLFSSLNAFRNWLVNFSGYDLNNIVFIDRAGYQASWMGDRAQYWRDYVPNYNLAAWADCQTMTDNIMQAGDIETRYFSSIVPDDEQSNLVSIAEYGSTFVYDPQHSNFYMWNPKNNVLWWIW